MPVAAAPSASPTRWTARLIRGRGPPRSRSLRRLLRLDRLHDEGPVALHLDHGAVALGPGVMRSVRGQAVEGPGRKQLALRLVAGSALADAEGAGDHGDGLDVRMLVRGEAGIRRNLHTHDVPALFPGIAGQDRALPAR